MSKTSLLNDSKFQHSSSLSESCSIILPFFFLFLIWTFLIPPKYVCWSLSHPEKITPLNTTGPAHPLAFWSFRLKYTFQRILLSTLIFDQLNKTSTLFTFTFSKPQPSKLCHLALTWTITITHLFIYCVSTSIHLTHCYPYNISTCIVLVR